MVNAYEYVFIMFLLSHSVYERLYGDDHGQVLEISDMEYGTFISPEFATVTAVIYHIAGLQIFMVRAPLALSRQNNYDKSFWENTRPF